MSAREADSVAVVPPVASLVYFVDEVHHKTPLASYLAAHREVRISGARGFKLGCCCIGLGGTLG